MVESFFERFMIKPAFKGTRTCSDMPAVTRLPTKGTIQALQAYLAHKKNLHPVMCSELSSTRLKELLARQRVDIENVHRNKTRTRRGVAMFRVFPQWLDCTHL